MNDKERADTLLQWAAEEKNLRGENSKLASDMVKLAAKLETQSKKETRAFDDKAIASLAKNNPHLAKPNPLRRMPHYKGQR
jgi:hypothetical protein